jgi:hypothetical protein
MLLVMVTVAAAATTAQAADGPGRLVADPEIGLVWLTPTAEIALDLSGQPPALDIVRHIEVKPCAGGRGLVEEWTFVPSKPIAVDCEIVRPFVFAPASGIGKAQDAFFALMLPDVPPGPKWLHEIAMIDYDYLSDNGQGWDRDVRLLGAWLKLEERRRVAFCLHGWYDALGPYCFDAATGQMKQEWVAFQPTRKVRLTQDEMRRRLRAARDLGFRALLYFGDGLASDSGVPSYRDDWAYRDARGQKIPGWQGPDTLGKTYMLNPAHPEVARWFLAYADALLKTYGMPRWPRAASPARSLGTDEAVRKEKQVRRSRLCGLHSLITAATRAAAAAGIARILDGEAPAHRAVLEINRGAVQVQGELLPRDQGHAVVLVAGIDLGIELGVKPERVGQPAATTAGNAHPQYGVCLDLLRLHDPLDFAGGLFRKNDWHK